MQRHSHPNSHICRVSLLPVAAVLALGLGCGKTGTPEGTRAATTPASRPNAAAFRAPDNVRVMPTVGHAGSVFAVAASRDGRLFVSGGSDNSVRLWDVEAGGVVGAIEALPAAVRSVALSDDGHRLAVGTNEAHVLLYELPSLRRIFIASLDLATVRSDGTRKPHEIWGVDVAPDGSVRSVATDGVMRTHDPLSGAVLKKLPGASDAWAPSVAFSRDHTRVLVGSEEGVEMRSTADGKTLATYTLPRTEPDAVGFSADGKYVIVAAYGRDHTVFDAATGTAVTRLEGAAKDCMMLATSPTEPLVALGCGGGDMFVYELPSGRMVHNMPVWEGSCNAGAFTENGKRLIEFHNDALSIYSRDTWSVVKSIKGAGYQRVSATFSDSGLGILSADKSLYLVDLPKLRVLGSARFPLGIEGASISRDGRVAIAGTRDQSQPNALVIVDVLTQTMTTAFPELRSKAWGALWPREGEPEPFTFDGEAGITALDRLGRTAITAPSSSSRSTQHGEVAPVAVLDIASRAIRGRLAVKGLPTSLALDPDGTRAVVGLSTGMAELWRLPSGGAPSRIAEAKLADAAASRASSAWDADVKDVAFSPDGKRIVARASDTLALFDAQTFAPLATTKIPHSQESFTRTVAYEADGVHVYVSGGRMATWTGTGALTYGRTLEMAPGYPSSFALGGSYIVGSGATGTLRIARTSQEASIDIAFDNDGEWLAFTPDGFLDGSKGGTSLVTAAVDMRAFDPMQLAPKLVRPDIIFERMGFGPPELVELFRRRRQAQLTRLGLTSDLVDGSAVRPPSARIVGVEKLDERRARLTFELTDDRGTLKSARIRVNGAPSEIAVEPKATYHGQLTLPLSAGLNRIEVSGTNAVGLESLRDVTVVESTRNAQGKLWFVGIGVSSYRDPALTLDFAAEDARAVGATFAKLPGFDGIEMVLVTDAEATKAGIAAALAKLEQATEDDTAVFFFAGHGTYLRGDFVLVPHDLDRSKAVATTLPFADVESALSKIRARKRLVLLDACRSGAEGAEPAMAAAGLRPKGTRDIGLERGDAAQSPHSTGLTYSNIDRERFLFSDFASRSGAVILSSSRGDEPSFELPAIRHGAFTSALLRALGPDGADVNRDGVVSGSELRSFVSRDVARLTGDRQHPVADRDVVGGGLALPSLGGAAPRGPEIDPVTGFRILRRP